MIENEKKFVDSVIENLISIHPLLSKGFTRGLRAKTNLNPGSLYVLGVLARHGKMSMSEIGCRLSMPKSHITGLVDKLIADDLVERLYDPNDRRIINIQITDKGVDDFKAIKVEISQDLREKLQLLNEEQLQTLATASLQVKDILIWMLQQHQALSGQAYCKG
jgi:DNA-binding MarR family transcriptional regulator